MTRFALLIAGALWAMGAPAASPALAQSKDQARANTLVEAGQRWRVLYEAGDWAGLRKLYTEDAVLMSQGQPKIKGVDKIIAFLQRLSLQGGKATFQFIPEEALIEKGMGFVTARYRMDITFPGNDPVAVAGRSMLIYKWQDGSWKLWRDIDNFAPDVTPQDFE